LISTKLRGFFAKRPRVDWIWTAGSPSDGCERLREFGRRRWLPAVNAHGGGAPRRWPKRPSGAHFESGLDGEQERSAANSAGCSGRGLEAGEGGAREAPRPPEFAPASVSTQNREGKRGGEIAHHDTKLRGGTDFGERRQSGRTATEQRAQAAAALES